MLGQEDEKNNCKTHPSAPPPPLHHQYFTAHVSLTCIDLSGTITLLSVTSSKDINYARLYDIKLLVFILSTIPEFIIKGSILWVKRDSTIKPTTLKRICGPLLPPHPPVHVVRLPCYLSQGYIVYYISISFLIF